MFLQFVFLIISLIQLIFDTFIRPIIMIQVDSSTILSIQALMNFVGILSLVIAVLSLIVPILLFFYFSKHKYQFANWFLFLIGLSIISIIFPMFINMMTHITVYIIFSYVRSILLFVITIILWFKASRTFVVRCIEIEPQAIE